MVKTFKEKTENISKCEEQQRRKQKYDGRKAGQKNERKEKSKDGRKSFRGNKAKTRNKSDKGERICILKDSKSITAGERH